jgi:carbonic anhydrase/acetyltransferase-like protein (isoleucine patch superfamily)
MDTGEDKYELLKVEGSELYQIKASKDFGEIKKGDLGGLVESAKNLSNTGLCWICEGAEVIEKAEVFGDAVVGDGAKIKGSAWIYNKAKVSGDVSIKDDVQIYGSALVTGECSLSGKAKLFDNCIVESSSVHERSEVYGNAHIKNSFIMGEAKVYGNAKVYMHSRIGGSVHVSGESQVVHSYSLKGCVNLTNRIYPATITDSNISIHYLTMTAEEWVSWIDGNEHFYTELKGSVRFLELEKLLTTCIKIQQEINEK